MSKIYPLLRQITDLLANKISREQTLQQAMQLLLESSGVCRVYYFELVPAKDVLYLANHLYEVCAEGVEPQIDNQALQGVPMIPYFAHWLEAFNDNRPYYGDVANMPDREREVLEEQGIKSIIVIPIYWDQNLVGFFGFDDTIKERKWTNDEVLLLRESSHLLGRLLAAQSINIALKKSKEHFHQLVDAMPIGSIELDNERCIVSWNAASTAMFGFTEDEVLGKSIALLTDEVHRLLDNQFPVSNAQPTKEPKLLNNIEVKPNAAENTLSEIKGTFRNQNTIWEDFVFTTNAQHKEGHTLPVQMKIRVVLGEKTRITRYIILIEDKTKEQEQLQTLREREELYRNLFERMNDGVVYQGESGKIIRGNKAACRLLGLTMDQLLGRESFDPRWKATKENGEPFPGDEHPAVIALRTGTYVENVIMGVFNPVENTQKWININATPEFRDGEDKPFRVFTLFRDVTEAIELKKKLVIQHQKFLSYAGTLSIGVWFRDENFKLTYVNEALAGIFGISKEEFYKNDGDKYADFVHPDDLQNVMRMQKKHMVDKEETNIVWRLIRADGEQRWVHVRQIYITTPGTEVPTSAGYMTDITEQRIKIEILESAKREAEHLSKLRMGIIESISHEFRTPITSIMGFTTLIQNLLDDPEMLQFAGMVHESADRLHKTLESILSYAALLSGKASVRPAAFELQISLSAVLELASNQAESKGLYFQAFLDKNLTINTDEMLLLSIIDQLLSNAIKFTAEGGLRLHVRVIGNRLIIEVIDTGIGIPEGLSLNVFEPFRQGSEGETRLYDGAGMGLSIIAKQVELLKGTMKYASNEYGGCTFKVVIPLEAGPDSNINNNVMPYFENESEIQILYVEDNPVLQLMMKKSMPEFNITAATKPEEALSLIDSKKFNVFLIDINLNHKMTGIDICNAVRSNPNQYGAFIIAITAQSRDKLETHMGDNGFNAYFSKPFNVSALKRTIKSYFGLKKESQ